MRTRKALNPPNPASGARKLLRSRPMPAFGEWPRAQNQKGMNLLRARQVAIYSSFPYLLTEAIRRVVHYRRWRRIPVQFTIVGQQSRTCFHGIQLVRPVR